MNYHCLLYTSIRNGVDLSVYKGANNLEKIKLRKEFSLPEDKKIVIYGGVFNELKKDVYKRQIRYRLCRGKYNSQPADVSASFTGYFVCLQI